MNIRIAKWSDIESLIFIYNQAIETSQRTADLNLVSSEGRRSWFESHTPERHPIYIIEFEQKVIGYLTLSAYRPGREALRFTAEISIYIHFDYHQKGHASLLLQYAIKQCPKLQLKTLFAILIDSNQASIGLFKKFGFKKWGHLPDVLDFNGTEAGHFYYGLRIS